MKLILIRNIYMPPDPSDNKGATEAVKPVIGALSTGGLSGETAVRKLRLRSVKNDKSKWPNRIGNIGFWNSQCQQNFFWKMKFEAGVLLIKSSKICYCSHFWTLFQCFKNCFKIFFQNFIKFLRNFRKVPIQRVMRNFLEIPRTFQKLSTSFLKMH